MNRSVRNGLAIAGMAGGIFFLGQAVASADTSTAVADTSATSAAPSSGADASNTNSQSVTASNESENTAKSGNIDASGTSKVAVVAGNGNSVSASSNEGDVKATQNVTNVVWVSSQGNGGTVSNSNNPSAGNGASNTATASGQITSTATGGSGKNGGDASNSNHQRINASNESENTAKSGNIDASGTSKVLVLAGNGNDVTASSGEEPEWKSNSIDWQKNYKHHEDNGDVNATQNIHNTVTVNSEAKGGSVSDSNNPSAGNGGRNTANAAGHITSKATGGDSKNSREDHQNKHDWWMRHKDGGDAENHNTQVVGASNESENTAKSGNIDASGTSEVAVIAGNGNTLYCTSVKGNVNCSQSITNIINIISQANGGTVSCSNNPSAGNSSNLICRQESAKPAEVKAAAPAKAAPAKAAPAKAAPAKAAPAKAAPVGHKAAALSSAQPSGQLAFTGAETSLPLTLGLVALGVGGALTLAGRRRETATV